MKGPLKESDKSYLRRWAYEHTWENVESKIEMLRQDAKIAEYGTKYRARLFAVANFLRYDKAIRRWFEDEPGGIWEGDDWERLPPRSLTLPTPHGGIPKGPLARPPSSSGA